MSATDSPGSKLARDIMVPLEQYPFVSETHTLRQAIDAMEKVQILRGKKASLPRLALVFDESSAELVGVLRRRDIMRGLEPNFLVSGGGEKDHELFKVDIDPNLAELSYDRMIARIRERGSRQVREVMRAIRVTIDYDDHLMKAIYEMVHQNVSLLPVLKNKSVVGVVRSVDVLREIAGTLES
jgi:predicted transcriptional regulator